MWLGVYLGGIICIALMMLAAANNGIMDDRVTGKTIVFVSVLWPIIFTILGFVKFK